MYGDHNSTVNITCEEGENTCPVFQFELYPQLLIIIVLSIIVLSAIIGNVLVIAAVHSQRRLRTVTNYYIVSLAWADLLVAILVMPFHVLGETTGKWWLGIVFCDIWISMDVLLCTASILNLCCISLDRYFAITQPLRYVTRRSKRHCFSMIAVVWVASVLITSPPLFGWKDPEHGSDPSRCELTKEPGYVIYSACGSFYIPLLVMVFVYARIFRVASDSEKRFGSIGDSRRSTIRRKKCLIAEEESPQLSCYSDDYRSGSEPGTPRKKQLCVAAVIRNNNCQTRTELMNTNYGSTGDNNHNLSFVDSRQRSRAASLNDDADKRVERSDDNLQTLSVAGKRTIKRYSLSDTDSLRSGSIHSPLKRKFDETKRERMLLRRESKIAKTLAIVIGCFVFCWLPFFLIYVIEPFCGNCHIPPILISSSVWLGYVNSALNPLIYGFFNVDFRKTFWKLTCGRCI
ncbi:5-hydroxytryptamine receptor 1A-like [Saccoglossus kowalevskii]|uniref:Tyramine/octopamine receptor-like n=1 Tax=Saccoglossus kowalevskii TaxID=10224 RepID=A0ABM0GNT8_SACKO|nr:PREDICTED: tyramine/octopamine receptor-like [Saccoglossus kowalevskii]